MLPILAAFLFVLAAFGVKLGEVNIVDIGLAFLALSLLFGNWPIGVWRRTS